jgi:hypothetical protein
MGDSSAERRLFRILSLGAVVISVFGIRTSIATGQLAQEAFRSTELFFDGIDGRLANENGLHARLRVKGNCV